ncbi:MAG: hypothetical protein UR28_C0026G0027 [Candidatus Peregrinibacteria bacterium GW2011_GWF2_33_10]|nr:MAG: hypothetical protein UR28_C0026G0027 [Candidatus Peregrinibacteria bacterium GW2011_GWF2_33_10]
MKLINFIKGDKFFLLLVSFCFLVVFYFKLSKYYFHYDDAFIIYNYVRNLINGYGFVYHPNFTPVQGSSSFLYTILLALICKIFPFFEIYKIGLMFSVLCYIGILFILYFLFKERFKEIKIKERYTIFIISFSFQIPLLFSLGMDWLFVNIFLLLIIYLIYRKSTFVNIFILTALLPLVRFEFLFFLPPILISYFLVNKNIPNTLKLIIGPIVLSFFYLIFSKIYFGNFLPQTWLAKLLIPSEVSGVINWISFINYNKALLFIIIIFIVSFILILKQILLKLLSNKLFYIFFIFFFFSVIYTLILGFKGAPNMPWYYVTTFLFIQYIILYFCHLIFLKKKFFAYILLTVILISNTIVAVNFSESLVIKTKEFIINKRGHEDRREKIGIYLSKISDIENKKILVYEIGKIAYFSKAKIYDILGLVSPEAMIGLEKNDTLLTLLAVDPDYVIGVDSLMYFPMKFLDSKYFKENYVKTYQVDDYIVWKRVKNN